MHVLSSETSFKKCRGPALSYVHLRCGLCFQEARFLQKCLLSAGRSEAVVKHFRADLVVITGVTRNASRLVLKLSKRGMIKTFLLAGYAGAELRETLAMLHDKAHKLSTAMTVTMPEEIKLQLAAALGDATKGFERMANRMARGAERAALTGAPSPSLPNILCMLTGLLRITPVPHWVLGAGWCRQSGRRRRNLSQPCPRNVERPTWRRRFCRCLRRGSVF